MTKQEIEELIKVVDIAFNCAEVLSKETTDNVCAALTRLAKLEAVCQGIAESGEILDAQMVKAVLEED